MTIQEIKSINANISSIIVFLELRAKELPPVDIEGWSRTDKLGYFIAELHKNIYKLHI